MMAESIPNNYVPNDNDVNYLMQNSLGTFNDNNNSNIDESLSKSSYNTANFYSGINNPPSCPNTFNIGKYSCDSGFDYN